MVDTVEILVPELCHVGVVEMDEVAHACEGAIDDGDLPGLAVVNLAGSGEDG